jgi:O-Antigen ligase
MSSSLASPPSAVAPPADPAPTSDFARVRITPRRPAGSVSHSPTFLARAWPTLLVAGVLCLVTFVAGAGLTSGGLNLGPITAVEIGLTLGCGLAAAAAIALSRSRRPYYGQLTAMLLLAFAALSALSVVWSVQPDASWQDASRLLAYGCVLGLAALLARAVPERWPAVLGGIVLASVVICGYALLTKVFPSHLGSEQITYYARLREPYGYWNATGLAAALGAVCCMWLGARRSGHALLSALAYPAMGIMLVTLLLAYSRGALAALLLGLALWLCIVPLRLRGAVVLLTGAIGAGAVVAWDFSTATLTTDSATLAQRVLAGHQLGVLLAAMVLGLALAGCGIGFLSASHHPAREARRRAGIALLSLPVLAVIALVGMLAVSSRGLYGSVSHDLGSLTNPNAAVPANGPGRLTALGSARAAYWKEALEVFAAHPALGAGAAGYETARLRYRTKPIHVSQAHGFVVQTLADLGLVGLALTLALLAAWLVAAGRSTHPLNRRWSAWRWRRVSGAAARYSPERVGLLTMVCVVATFGVHSFVDWTWYVPGLACTALLCAGWVAGRGPLAAGSAAAAPRGQARAVTSAQDRPPEDPERRWLGGRVTVPSLRAIGPARGAVAAAMVIATLLAAWAQWQPQRSVDASNEALALAQSSPLRALRAAHTAVARDPLSAEALLTLAAIQQRAGEPAAARATYASAVHLQPSNPQTWQALGEYDLSTGNARGAVSALRAAVYLNPQAVAPRASIEGNEELITLQSDYLQALRASAGAARR